MSLILTSLSGFGSSYGSPFPEVRNTATSTNASGTSHTVSLPSGIQSGELLVAFVVDDAVGTHTWPGGWTELYDTDTDTGLQASSAAYRVADGSEGASITVTTSTSTTTAHIVYRIGNYQGVPEVGTALESSSTTPNPPSLSPSWGSDDTLWLACAGARTTGLASAAPTNYSNLLAVAHTTPGPSAMSARRERNASGEDPGTFTIPSSVTWTSQTIAIRGA